MPDAPHPIVIVTEPLARAPQEWLDSCADTRFCPFADQDQLREQLAHADGLVVRTYTRVDEKLLACAPNLRVVARAGVGVDNIDLDACRSRSIRVVHTPGANTDSVVEYVASMLINTWRPIEKLNPGYTPSQWHTLRERAITERSVVGQQLGIIGLGRIGSRVAALSRALGMNPVYTDLREITHEHRNGAVPVTLDDLLRGSDAITLHIDGREENTGFLNAACFAKMKPEALFINASRGRVVDPIAAMEYARRNPGARVVLDVHDPEPIDQGSSLLNCANITLTPHIASGTTQAKEAMSWVVRDLMRVLRDEQPEHSAV